MSLNIAIVIMYLFAIILVMVESIKLFKSYFKQNHFKRLTLILNIILIIIFPIVLISVYKSLLVDTERSKFTYLKILSKDIDYIYKDDNDKLEAYKECKEVLDYINKEKFYPIEVDTMKIIGEGVDIKQERITNRTNLLS